MMMGELNTQQIEELLSKQVVGRIACYQENFIYLIPMSYAYNDGFIYSRSIDGLKLDIMRKNPNVCFEVDTIADMANWQSVIAWGQFEELKNDEKEEGLRILLHRHLPLSSSITTHLGKAWPFSEHDLEEITGVVFRIKLTKKTGRFEQTSVPDPTLE
jgi:nitroimidazol reductase NimA-like FMN-containing flavoprotein (pyridoxamine 5'-phosphate oxidase superfamily)